MKIAKFKSLEHGFDSFSGDELEECEGYIRTTEYVDVEFPPLKNEDIVKNQVSALNEVKKGIQAATQLKINEVDRQIGELLALPQPE